MCGSESRLALNSIIAFRTKPHVTLHDHTPTIAHFFLRFVSRRSSINPTHSPSFITKPSQPSPQCQTRRTAASPTCPSCPRLLPTATACATSATKCPQHGTTATTRLQTTRITTSTTTPPSTTSARWRTREGATPSTWARCRTRKKPSARAG